MIRRPPRSTQSRSSAASDVYKRQAKGVWGVEPHRGFESLRFRQDKPQALNALGAFSFEFFSRLVISDVACELSELLAQSLVDGRAPPAAPIASLVAHLVDLAAVAFGWATFLQCRGWLGGQAAQFCGLFAGGDAVRGFFVQLLGHWRGAPGTAQAPYEHLSLIHI